MMRHTYRSWLRRVLLVRVTGPRRSRWTGRAGMTFMEVLVVVSLMALVSMTIYKSLVSGIQVWERSRRSIVEEDVTIFFDKLSRDARNMVRYALIPFEGEADAIRLPTMVHVPADPQGHEQHGSIIEQVGSVEYYFDRSKRSIFRRQANYSQSLNKEFDREQLIVPSVHQLVFQYVYLTDTEEIIKSAALDKPPATLEVLVYLSDTHKKVMRCLIDIPLALE